VEEEGGGRGLEKAAEAGEKRRVIVETSPVLDAVLPVVARVFPGVSLLEEREGEGWTEEARGGGGGGGGTASEEETVRDAGAEEKGTDDLGGESTLIQAALSTGADTLFSERERERERGGGRC